MGGVGILGGTFDPPHLGHLAMAECASNALNLTQILFMPVGQPPHKAGEQISSAAHRLEMTRLAVAGNERFKVDRRDIDRPPPHTTISLLPLLQAGHPDETLWLVIGADSLIDLPTWVAPRDVIQQCRLAVVPRPGFVPDMEALEAGIPGVSDVVSFINAPAIGISSTDIRRRLGLEMSARYLCPDAVLAYALAHGLYC